MKKSTQRLIEETLGQTIEELGISTVPNPETPESKMFEAQAVMDYYERSKGFKEIPCKECGQIFAYRWYFDGIKYCTVNCMQASLLKIGIVWDPEKAADRRWVLTRPTVVSSAALPVLQEALSQQSSSPVDQELKETPLDPPPDTSDPLLALLLG